ncbi:DUF4397 domain-containing protein [Pedobacter punctiformis]|uniref:DUF4397 domain-containing protein n=1 Tax=Pedobacter punctiformis TaxID=3004097 RepID=A0ABT4L551_9SPHI|nr:DUF4397 domain-containing protein [Pedobacter sp. HCMS5-2]MCZ4243045.1 DUF4397 domain-containing protein [Pedobacter sp. HCMS5-2]
MKNKYIIIPVFAFLLSMLLYSCEKNAVQIIDVPVSGAQLKFFNFGVNAPIVNFYANDTKVSAALSATGSESSTTGVAYGAVYPSVNSYAVIAPGTYNFKGQRPSTVSTDANLAISTLNTSVQEGKNYSLYLSGIYNASAKTIESFIVEDVLPPVDTSGGYVRFVHAISNANPFNLVLKNTTTGAETVVATNIAYKSASSFVKVPFGIYELYCRYPNSSTNVISRNGTSAVSVIKANTYTFSIRGDMTVTSTTATNRPFIDNTPNR